MSRAFSFTQKILLFVAGFLGPALINLLGFTWRVKITGQVELSPKREKTEKNIYCFWHNKLLGLAYTQKKKNAGIMISSHFDGEIIARIVARMGYHPLRGSSTKGGAVGLLSMLKNDKVWHLAITVDGPRGPQGVVKPGAIYLASKSGLPVVPISCLSARKWVLSSWDNFEIPKPFAKVTISFGKAIYVNDISDNAGIREYKEHLTKALNELENCL